MKQTREKITDEKQNKNNCTAQQMKTKNSSKTSSNGAESYAML